MSPDRAVILAAGLGTRLKWLTHGQPKALMDVAGLPAIVRVIRHLAGAGIHDIAINVHHHADRLVAALGDGAHFGVRLYYSREKTLLDSGGGVRTALEKLPGEGRFVVHNADVLANIDLHRLGHACPAGGCALALVPNPPHHPEGDFGLDGQRVSVDSASRYTYAGVSVWDDAVLRKLPANEAWSLVGPMRELARQGLAGALLHRGTWLDIGRPRDLMQARRLFAERGS